MFVLLHLSSAQQIFVFIFWNSAAPNRDLHNTPPGGEAGHQATKKCWREIREKKEREKSPMYTSSMIHLIRQGV